jgi:hypothetical protein
MFYFAAQVSPDFAAIAHIQHQPWVFGDHAAKARWRDIGCAEKSFNAKKYRCVHNAVSFMVLLGH